MRMHYSRGRLRLCLLLSVVVAMSARRAWAAEIESWTDARLPVREGLEAWFDATAQNAARKLQNLPEWRDGAEIDVWRDGSGHGRDVVQSDAVARPKLRIDEGVALARFDGDADFLAAEKLMSTLAETTVFVVAAPVGNDGDFRALFAINAEGNHDYTSGLNIDQGWAPTLEFETVNVEGAGFSGMQNLKRGKSPYYRVMNFCVTSAVGPKGTKLYVNGKAGRSRDRAPSTLGMDRLTIGARYHGQPLQTRGMFAGDVAEVLVYNRVLKDEERTAVDRYLLEKYGPQRDVPKPPGVEGSKPLETVANPPPVQMFVGGFPVRELPVDLTNINNIQYREDGALVALAYDGKVYLLRDTDGDGLEDQAKPFWNNPVGLRAVIGMALTPPGYSRGRGVFVPSKSKCSLIVDTDGDDVADQEITVAEGWAETPQGVDALGATFDPRDGSVYFGLGCQDYTNAYVPGPDGKARYRLDSERGTILKVAPDFKSREIVATGIRFPVGIRFNRAGDLFCTDQEGATWLANGNPFDELLHVERGRHYGFPPRHPRHLPNVIDEPSTFDYGPQHQSTCGLNFNEPVNGGPTFGPKYWQSDAFVTGYSRGKLYRTKLVKSPAGYVAQSQLLASLAMLTADACISPTGELLIATHSGGPDWGSGPNGKGKLYKVSYAAERSPLPVLAWAQSPQELRIAFDRELRSDDLKEAASKASIDVGDFVAAGDRFEAFRPGYAVVARQMRAPRFDVKVHGVQLAADRRTLILATSPQRTAAGYAVTLPGLGRQIGTSRGELPQAPETDLQYDLSGVAVSWQARGGSSSWSGWLPHADLNVARPLTEASSTHDELWQLAREEGTLALETQLRLFDMLRPVVQPGSKIDYEWPAEQVTLVFSSNARPEIEIDGTPVAAAEQAGDRWISQAVVRPTKPEQTHRLNLRLTTGGGSIPSLDVHYFTAEDARPRALPLRRFLLPWAMIAEPGNQVVDNRDLPELKGGHWLRGRRLFYGDKANCSKCHKVGGEGGAIGPDLSNLVHRDYASVLRDVTQPSFAINPDFVSQAVVLNDGRIVTGTLRTHGDQLTIGTTEGRDVTVARADVESIEASPQSIMPQEIPKQLGPDAMRDLLTFLLTEGPRMPDYGRLPPPAPRSPGEVKKVLAGSVEALATRPLHIVLVAGRKDHGPGEHDYPAWMVVWQRLLELAENVRVTSANDWPTAADLKSADVLVFYQQGQWTPERARDLDALFARGGGAAYIHFAVDGGNDPTGFAQRIGLAWHGGQSRYRHGPLEIDLRASADHPIARNFEKLHLHDESYWNLVGNPTSVRLLGTGAEEGREQPLFWTAEPGKGKVFVSIPGHFAWSFDDPLFRVVLLRGIAWCAGEPVDRFNELVVPGARIAPPAAESPPKK